MIEEWKDIEGYEGYYQVSNTGKVKSIGRYVKRNGEKFYFRKGRFLKPSISNTNCSMVCLYKDGVIKWFLVHRLVAAAFIPNPNNLPEVNHKDENRLNNFVCVNPDGSVDAAKSNLEWCTSEYNINFGTRNKRAAEKLSKAVLQFDKNGVLIKKWSSIIAPERELGIKHQSICRCCKGKSKSAYGYVWKYKE